MEKDPSLINMPDRLFKYYKYDDKLNRKRLKGEVYLSSPLDFNDPCDCRVRPKNNAGELGKKESDWLKFKMRELGYDEKKSGEYADSLKRDDSVLDEVYHRQLERVGILCLTFSFSDAQMWGYYADNTGICIEYNTEAFVKQLLIGFVNSMDYGLTKLLFNDKGYHLSFEERRKEKKRKMGESYKEGVREESERERFARELIPDSSFESLGVDNVFLKEIMEKGKSLESSADEAETQVINFVRHVFVKRMVGEEINYVVKLGEVPPTLFFDSDNEGSRQKYFQKTKVWEHEKEFRIVVSLGGRKVINLGKDMIKSVYFGCDVPYEKVLEIAYMMDVVNEKCELFMMKRMPDGSLKETKISGDKLTSLIREMRNLLE